jgi:ankyrin repeat protein
MRSATAGFEGVVEALLRAKCAVDLRMRTGDSPLHLASGARTGRCCATSLKLKVSGQGLGLGIARATGARKPQHRRSVRTAWRLLPDRPRSQCGHGECAPAGAVIPPWRRAAAGHVPIVRALCDARADVNALREDSNSPVSLAVRRRSHPSCMGLIHAG